MKEVLLGTEKLMTGLAGEEEAAAFLKDEGYKIVERNYRTRSGEIDIIARDGDTVVFVEVKTRTQSLYGAPEESVGAYKRGNVIAASMHYLNATGLDDCSVRYDVISVEVREDDKNNRQGGGGEGWTVWLGRLGRGRRKRGYTIRHIKDAFEA